MAQVSWQTTRRQLSPSQERQSRKPVWFDDDSDWEYEYDEDETEDFYFTLDLTTHVPDALVKKPPPKKGRRAKGALDTRLREASVASDAALTQGRNEVSESAAKDLSSRYAERANSGCESGSGSLPDPPSPLGGPNGESPAASTGNVNVVDALSDVQETTSEPEGRLQLIGLHTPNPYLIFNNTFYSSYWLSDLGTQMWISRPGVSESTVFSGHVLDVIGASQARLVAKPATIQQRQEEIDDEYGEGTAEADATPLDDLATTLAHPNDHVDPTIPTQPLKIPQSTILDPSLRSHATFMERFSALKVQKGETDQMPLHSVKSYDIPANAMQIRAEALDAEDRARAVSGTSRSKEGEAKLVRNPWALAVKRNKRTGGPPRLGRKRQGPPLTDLTIDDENENENGDGNGIENGNENGNEKEATPRAHSSNPPDDPSPAALEDDEALTRSSRALRRGRRTDNDLLAGLGLNQSPPRETAPPKAKRRRRTKQQVEDDRTAAAAAAEDEVA